MAFANTHKEDPKRILIVDDNPKEVADVIRHLATYVFVHLKEFLIPVLFLI